MNEKQLYMLFMSGVTIGSTIGLRQMTDDELWGAFEKLKEAIE